MTLRGCIPAAGGKDLRDLQDFCPQVKENQPTMSASMLR